MKRHRFVVPFPLAKGSCIVREREIVHQIVNVLRLSLHEEIVLSDGKGHEAPATIERVDKKEIHLLIGNVQRNENEPEREVTLCLAILKRENFEWAAQKATEVGVTRILPIITKRTVKLDLKRERIQKILREAAEQCGRSRVPELAEPVSFDDALSVVADVKWFCALDVDGKNPSQPPPGNPSVAIFIGPEGGWDPEEIEAARKAGCDIVSLGSLALRAETAAIIATYRAVSGI
jgi:16S rRNA (uracil1498-N3)-methyltransferase